MRPHWSTYSVGDRLRSVVGHLRAGFAAAGDGIMRLSGPAFQAVILFAFACALSLIAFGLEDMADLRDQKLEAASNNLAASPIAYGDRIFSESESDRRGGERSSSSLTALLRVDSLPVAAGTEVVCISSARIEQWLASRTDVSLRYVALNEPDANCAEWSSLEVIGDVGGLQGSSSLSAVPWKSMRWAITDAKGRSLYSRSHWPTLEQIAGVIDVLRGRPFDVDAGEPIP